MFVYGRCTTVRLTTVLSFADVEALTRPRRRTQLSVYRCLATRLQRADTETASTVSRLLLVVHCVKEVPNTVKKS